MPFGLFDVGKEVSTPPSVGAPSANVEPISALPASVPTASGSNLPAPGRLRSSKARSRSPSPRRRSRSPVPLASRVGPRVSKGRFTSPLRRVFRSSPDRSRYSRGNSPRLPPISSSKGKDSRPLRERVDFIPTGPPPPPRASSGSKSKGKARRISPTPPSSSVSSSTANNGLDDVYTPVPGSKKPRLFAAPIKELVDSKASPLARAIQRLVTTYKSDIDHHTDQFNCSPNKPTSWPVALTKDLLKYKVIDLEKLWGAMSSSPLAEIFIFDKRTKKMDVKGVTDSLEIQDLSDFTQIMEVLRHAYLAAFYIAEVPIKAYFKQISSLCRHQSKIHWSHVRNYDAEMRQEFSHRPSLAWGDFDAPELKIFEGRNLHVKYVAPTASPKKFLTSSSGYQPAPSQPRASSSRKAPSAPSKPKKAGSKRTKRDFPPYEIKDATDTTTATEPISYATSWDASVITAEASLTDEPNARKFFRNMEIDALWEGFSSSVDFSITADPLPSAPPLESDIFAARAIRRFSPISSSS
ncbi:uncharacterized protein MELLADRAFT_101513 [Melampsora larici-populina 98AG31]|uniref:Uncharacterized protein n=1 Tax=Melampsora larici-populina (strain 98AG31 / pathotype 3-4-7) TaxID=747676 RepID=F4R2Y6_MELLP|nr:uncharacterized protein MELLADRAFT_101513 [Melampsora larici-populina 98AG31]EGG12895.1 hypothetical protein MELLADRAFT_101513 [Melampsora larici-populina 98AG31]